MYSITIYHHHIIIMYFIYASQNNFKFFIGPSFPRFSNLFNLIFIIYLNFSFNNFQGYLVLLKFGWPFWSESNNLPSPETISVKTDLSFFLYPIYGQIFFGSSSRSRFFPKLNKKVGVDFDVWSIYQALEKIF